MNDILDILDAAQLDAAKLLAHRVKEGTATAADINALRAMFREAGGTLYRTDRQRPTEAGQGVIDALKDVDPSLFN